MMGYFSHYPSGKGGPSEGRRPLESSGLAACSTPELSGIQMMGKIDNWLDTKAL